MSLSQSPAASARSLPTSPSRNSGHHSDSTARTVNLPPFSTVSKISEVSDNGPEDAPVRQELAARAMFKTVENFLDLHRDAYGARQSALWLFTEWGRAVLCLGTIICHRLRVGVDCYARIVQFIARSHNEALFQTKLIGWQTPKGWHDQSPDVFHYIVAPLERCNPEFSGPGWSYFTYDDSIKRLAEDAIARVKFHLGNPTPLQLPGGDHIIGWMIQGFKMSPVLHAFDTRLSTGLTVAVDDLHLPIRVDMVPAPVALNPVALTVSLQTCLLQNADS
ncbi:unnamed protein product [Peniophora sp. CBMAI 1063]|nr:unnamed protein product [Peniophora sp. CBMAI 1063]